MRSETSSSEAGRSVVQPKRWIVWTAAMAAVPCLLAAWQGATVALLVLPMLAWMAYLAKQMKAVDACASPGATSLNDGSAGLPLMLEQVLPVWAAQVDQIHIDLQAGTSELLDSFSQILDLESRCALLNSLDQLPELQSAFAQQTERAMHGLQFSDRITQMLALLKEDIERLKGDRLSLQGATLATAERWLEELERRYTTDEQRARHMALTPTARQDSVDFF